MRFSLKHAFKKEAIMVPVAHDALSAKIFEKAGFKAILLGGYGVSASLLGVPDVGLISLLDMVYCTRNVTNSIDIPVLVDANTGYGNAINVIHTVVELEKAGAAGVMIEDQLAPPKSPTIGGIRQTISLEEMQGKIRAAAETRKNRDFIIIARTDSLGEEAVKRANAYTKMGADVIYIGSAAMKNKNDVKFLSQSIETPLAISLFGWFEKELTVKELEGMGYRLLFFPVQSVLATAKALIDLAEELKHKKSTISLSNNMITMNEFKELVGFSKISAWEQKYLIKEGK